MTEVLLTVNEVAERLKCHPHTVRRWIWSHKLRAVKVGDLVRVPQEEVDRLLRPTVDRKSPATGPAALLAAMEGLKGAVNPLDMKRVEDFIAEAEQQAEWTAPLA